MKRRTLLRVGLGAGLGGTLGQFGGRHSARRLGGRQFRGESPAYSVIPVVGDGKWIWMDPPKDQTGYVEPRSYDVSVGVQLQGSGNATQVKATTTVPVACGEQKIEQESIEAEQQFPGAPNAL